MRSLLLLTMFLMFCVAMPAQNEMQQLVDADAAFNQAALSGGPKAASALYASDAIVFFPGPVNARQYWSARPDTPERLRRDTAFADIASSGKLGYTFGSWALLPKAGSDGPLKSGHFVTIWEKRGNGAFVPTVDMTVADDGVTSTPERLGTGTVRDANKRGWSAADPSMNFFKLSMSSRSLAAAYDKFAADEIRLFRDGEPPIIGKKRVVAESKQYRSLEFPKKVSLLESADMAYVWNPCEYSNSSEGVEKGNCLQIWKLRGKQWFVVVGVFSRMPNMTPPSMKSVYGKRPKKMRPRT